MKKLSFLTFFVILGMNLAFAQSQPQPSAQVKKEIAILQKADLGLTEQQVMRLTTVLMGEERDLEMSLKALEGNKSQQEIRIKAHHDNKIRNIKGVLTPVQAEKFDTLKLDSKM